MPAVLDSRPSRSVSPSPIRRVTDPLTPEGELWRRLAAGPEPRARDELIRRHLDFAKRLALRYRNGAEPFDDLLQVANLGLLKAVDRFDPSRGIPFTGFATPTILGELRRHFRDRVWTVRVPRGIHDLMADVEKTSSRLMVELQRSPSVAEIAARLGVDPAEVVEVLAADRNRRAVSLDLPLDSEDEVGPSNEWLGDTDAGYGQVDDRLTIEEVLPELDSREREALKLRFVDDLTQSEIAARVGCSQMHVSRILQRSMERIRERVSEGNRAA